MSQLANMAKVKKKMEEDLLGQIPLYHSILSEKRIKDVEDNINIKDYLILKHVCVEKYKTSKYRIFKPSKKVISKVIDYNGASRQK